MSKDQFDFDDLDSIIRISRQDEKLKDPYILHNVCLRQDIDLLLQLLEVDNRAVNGRNQNGLAPIHVSVVSAEPPRLEDLINFLLFYGAGVNNTCTPSGDTSLHLAVIFSKLDNAEISVPLLLREGADPKIRNFAGRTARDYAIANGYDDLAALLEEIELHPERRSEIDPYDWKSKFGSKKDRRKSDEELLSDAIDNGDDDGAAGILKRILNNNQEDNTNSLHKAITSRAGNRIQMVQSLVKAGADVKAVDSNGDTPIQLAIREHPHNDEMVPLLQALLEAGVPKNVKNKENKTALSMAQERRYADVEELLADPPSNPKPPAPKPAPARAAPAEAPAKSNEPRKTVHEVLNDKSMTVKSKLATLTEMWKQKPPPDVNELSTDGEENTPLHVTVQRDQEALTEFLLDKNALVNVKNKRRQSPLMLAQNTKFGINSEVYEKLRNAHRKQQARKNWKKMADAMI